MAAKGKAMAKEGEMEEGYCEYCGDQHGHYCGHRRGKLIMLGFVLVVLGLASMYGASLAQLAVLLGLLLILKGLIKMAMKY